MKRPGAHRSKNTNSVPSSSLGRIGGTPLLLPGGAAQRTARNRNLLPSVTSAERRSRSSSPGSPLQEHSRLICGTQTRGATLLPSCPARGFGTLLPRRNRNLARPLLLPGPASGGDPPPSPDRRPIHSRPVRGKLMRRRSLLPCDPARGSGPLLLPGPGSRPNAAPPSSLGQRSAAAPLLLLPGCRRAPSRNRIPLWNIPAATRIRRRER